MGALAIHEMVSSYYDRLSFSNIFSIVCTVERELDGHLALYPYTGFLPNTAICSPETCPFVEIVRNKRKCHLMC